MQLSGDCCAVAVKTKLAVDQFTVVLEDDGSSVDDDVMTAIIEGETLGTLMVLKESEIWTRGSFFKMYFLLMLLMMSWLQFQ